MALQNRLEQSQKTVITQAMQQSLKCLQMPIHELREFIQETALSNPFVEFDDVHPEILSAASSNIEFRERSVWYTSNSELDGDAGETLSYPQTYSDYLNEQLMQLNELDPAARVLCRYIVGNLNSAGYLDCSVDELSVQLGVSAFDMEQALFVVQSLDPPGTGARNLSECLILQLARSNDFNELNLHIAKSGLAMIADRNFSKLAKKIGVTLPEVKKAAKIISKLNPIPSRGFYTGEKNAVIIPEASIYSEGDSVLIEMNSSAIPMIQLNQYYCSLVGMPGCEDAQPYLKQKLAEAKMTMNSVAERNSTIYRLLSCVVNVQGDFFRHSGDLKPMTMQQIADQIEMNVSTVSRTVRDKYICFNGQLVLLRSLFSNSLQASDGSSVSSEMVRAELQRLIKAEDPKDPLSDAALSKAMSCIGIDISRRTVAKYRAKLNIPSALERRDDL